MACWKAENETSSMMISKDMGVGSLGRSVNADSKCERGEYHIFTLFQVKRGLKLTFLDLSYILCGTIIQAS